MRGRNVRSNVRSVVGRATHRILGPFIDKLIGPALERRIRPILDRHEYQLAPERVLENRYLAAKKINPLGQSTGYSVIPNKLPPEVGDLPVPPPELWEGYGETADEYLSMGREHVAVMERLLAQSGADLQNLTRIFDFGCAAGRMLRFLPRGHELWGADIKADTISWCEQNLPFNFLAATTFPHLPFEDGYFDLVYAGSVFTHIIDLPDAWFLELRRVVRKGGYIFITIHDKHTLELAYSKYGESKGLAWFVELLRRVDKEAQFSSQDFGCFSFEGGSWGGFPVPQVFYDADYLGRKWSRWARLLSTTEEAYGWQTALLFQK